MLVGVLATSKMDEVGAESDQTFTIALPHRSRWRSHAHYRSIHPHTVAVAVAVTVTVTVTVSVWLLLFVVVVVVVSRLRSIQLEFGWLVGLTYYLRCPSLLWLSARCGKLAGCGCGCGWTCSVN